MKYKDVMELIIKNRLENEYLDFQPGGACSKIKKLTKEYVIFKGCHYKWEYKYYFDFADDLDDKVLYYLLRKHRKAHFQFKAGVSVRAGNIKKKKYSEKQKEILVQEVIDVLGNAYMHDVSEVIGLHPLEVGKIFKKIEEKGKGKWGD